MSDFLQSCTVDVNHIKIKFAPLGVFKVLTENDSLAIGVQERSKGSTADLGDLLFIVSIGIHDPNL